MSLTSRGVGEAQPNQDHLDPEVVTDSELPGPDADFDSIVALLTDLVRTPSRGGLDSYEGVIGIVEAWLDGAGLGPKVLPGPDGPLGIVCDVVGSQPGPHLVLDACLDTADIGDESAWTVGPYSAEIIDGWLHGRGSSDSKAAVSIFCHLAAQLAADPDSFRGTLTLLFDLDEHTGGFGGIRSYLRTEASQEVAGVMIGYPGPDTIVVGGRGFLRAKVTVFGQGDHSASGRRKVSNAIVRASHLVDALGAAVPDRVIPGFGLPPKLTVTSIRSGTPGAYSVVPDRCELDVDVRLTPDFGADDAWRLLIDAAKSVDRSDPAPRRTRVDRAGESWPPFQLRADHWLPAALLSGARAAGFDPLPVVAGPSNIGNLLATRGIPATAGFGVRYRNLHAPDEAIELATIPGVQGAYQFAVTTALGPH